MTNFTPEDLLLYLYKETSAKQTDAIEKALHNDWTLREKLNVLKASMERLDKITPHRSCIECAESCKGTGRRRNSIVICSF